MHGVKRLFKPVCTDPPLLALPPKYVHDRVNGVRLHMLSLVCIAREFFHWIVHVISTGPISTVQTECQGSCILIGQLSTV